MIVGLYLYRAGRCYNVILSRLSCYNAAMEVRILFGVCGARFVAINHRLVFDLWVVSR